MDQRNYYSKRILKTIASIEIKTGQMFHNLYPDLHQEFWNIYDHGQTRKLMHFSFKLDKLFDTIERGIYD